MERASPLDLRAEWAELLRRRATLAPSLRVYGAVLEAWVVRTPAVVPLAWGHAQCSARWERGVPLLAEAPPPCAPADLEPLLGDAMAALATLGPEAAGALQRLAEAWDRGEIALEALLPAPGRLGDPEVETRLGLGPGLLGVLAVASLRPVLDAYFAATRGHPAEAWRLGICPFCGAPPAWADLLEDGHRRLACDLCGAGWRFGRLTCPYCGSLDGRDAVRLQAEGADEGYAVAACGRCKGYLKELDRRVRWNAGSALVEDWGSPHLDLVARRRGYWRGVPTLVQLQAAAP
ncbi:MAG: formate dehydrogenase accessory protein FdhE [Candidatus Rokubacteria bacterium]|nr:formate dehydrogenase accessory protein FdhE [Candidatus Rokubacteria bacterium]